MRTVLGTLRVFRLQAESFANRDLREHVAQLQGLSPDDIAPGRVPYATPTSATPTSGP